MKPKFNVNKL